MILADFLLPQAINLFLVPALLVGLMRKVKALMQNRVGVPILQPFFDVAKLFRKSETISASASWIFIWAPRIGLGGAIIASVLIPWAGPLLPREWAPCTDFLFLVYFLALSKFCVMLAAMDTGSVFGGLGASREATLSLLVEPALVIGLAAMAIGAGSTNMLTIYATKVHPIVAALVGAALLVAAIAELSRMPVDDPTTHLELTMVHEAMILENSGRNLALTEIAVAIRTCIYLGLSAQSFMHLSPLLDGLGFAARYVCSILAVFTLGVIVAVCEGVLVKLKWRSVPNFLAFATVASVLATLVAVARN